MRFICGPISLLGVLLWLASATGQDSPPALPNSSAKARPLPPAYATRHLDVEIPFKITPGSDPAAQPTAVQVFVSWDFGRNWHKYTQVPPDAGKFRFKAKKDAEFWFVTEAIDRSGRAPSDAPKWPQMRLVIDTQQPKLLATAAVNPSGQVDLTWSADDPHLSAESLKFEYQDARDADGSWVPVSIPTAQSTISRGGLAGRTAFAPQDGLRAINVRAEVADLAGNRTFFHQQLAIPHPDQRQRGRPALDSPLALDPGARRWPSDNRTDEHQQPDAGASNVESIARPAARDDGRSKAVVANPHVRRDRLTAGPTQPSPSEEPDPVVEAIDSGDNLPPPMDRKRPPAIGNSSESGTGERSRLPFPDLTPPMNSTSSDPSSESLPPPPSLPPPRPTTDFSQADIGPVPSEEPLPPPAGDGAADSSIRGNDVATTDSIPAGTEPRLTNAKRFSLDYDVESVGPEGIAEVELWGTSDGGKTWLKWGADPDRISPMEVEVASEATYGFRVLILGKNGLEGNKPQSGDDADIWVNIDVTRPIARITAAAYGKGESAGKLDIRWEASDANLGRRPVTLLYSDRPEGKFTVIAAGLENTGQYLWQFDPRSPRTIYLRMEVRDDAGNIAIDQLTDPISIEGLIPKGRIRSLSPAPEPLPASGAFHSPLFR